MFLPQFDDFCALLLNRRTATWNLFVNPTIVNVLFVIGRQVSGINYDVVTLICNLSKEAAQSALIGLLET